MGAALRVLATQLVTSPRVRGLQRTVQSIARTARFARPTVLYFHDADDPYSRLTAQILPALMGAYDVRFDVRAVPPPDAAAAPDRERLAAYSIMDAERLARAHGLDVHAPAPVPSGAGALAENDALRRRLGHYLGATFYFEGEWYWGLDRAPHLEARLAPFRRKGASPVVRQLEADDGPAQTTGGVIDFYLSFRSPYTYLAADRVQRLSARHGAQVRLKFVLPMVMRGLPVPGAKRLYIVRDAKREAERLGLPFGKIADPVGPGAERGLAVLHRAISLDRGPAFVESFLRGVFAEGVDSATDQGLLRLAARAGLDAPTVRDALADPSWRAVAEANREALFALGLWGVPSFQVEGFAPHWGQDRLWAVQEDLRARAKGTEAAA